MFASPKTSGTRQTSNVNTESASGVPKTSKFSEDPEKLSSQTPYLAKGECGDCVIRKTEMAYHIAVLQAKLTEETQSKNQLSSLLAELDEKIGDRDRKIEMMKREKSDVELARDELKTQLEATSKHLDATESCFNDIHEKYERAKQTIRILHQDIETLKQSLGERDSCIKQKHEQFLRLKEHAMDRMDHANTQLDLIERKYSLESSKLRAAAKESELAVQSLSEQLEQGKKENAELTSICNGLIEKLHEQNESTANNLLTYPDSIVSSLKEQSCVSANI